MPPERVEPIVLRMSEVAKRLAIHRATAYRLVASGELRGIRVGTAVRVLRADFDAYIERQRAAADAAYRQAKGAEDD